MRFFPEGWVGGTTHLHALVHTPGNALLQLSPALSLPPGHAQGLQPIDDLTPCMPPDVSLGADDA